MKLMCALFTGLLIVATASVALATPPAEKPADKPAPAPTAYNARTTAMLMNLCRESLCKIVNYQDRFVLDEEYSRLANNIDVTLIRDDEIADLIKRLMVELNALKLDEASKAQIVGAYEHKLNAAILQAIKPPADLLGPAATPVKLACQAILITAWGTTNRAKAIAKYNKELAEKIIALKADEMRRLTRLRTDFFGTEYVLYRKYNLPDRLNLKEVQLDQYIRVLQDDDAARRLQRLERLKDDFDAYPPFWFQFGLAAQESGKASVALEYYRHYDQVSAPVLREDPDRVAVCMHRIMLLDSQKDRDAILRDLQTIERNTKYYYRWENMLFAALTYYGLGDVENARRLIQTSIDEGYNVPLHEQVRVAMESAAAHAQLEQTRQDMLHASNNVLLEDRSKVGRTNALEVVRAWGARLTDISVRVEPRSHAGQSAAYAVPGYNVYLLGRGAIKGDVYFDNIVVRLPAAWASDKIPPVTLRFNGKVVKAAEKKRDERSGELVARFPRVFDQNDILQRGRTYPCTLVIGDPAGTVEIGYEAQRVTGDLLKLRPGLPENEPYFAMRTLDYLGQHYRLDHGLIVPN